MNSKIAFFRFEANHKIGAGHAVRSSVLAAELIKRGWHCVLLTKHESTDFIKNLKVFEQMDPDSIPSFIKCDLLVIDNYEFDHIYESQARSIAKKIMVIDDLANRKHDCDLILDVTHNRKEMEYRPLVPDHCKMLLGSDYIMLPPEFYQLREKALEKRKNTKEVKRILVSMGGSDPCNFTLKALHIIKDSGFKGAIDVVLGFDDVHYDIIRSFLNTLENESKIYTDANMPKLIFEADIGIGAAGTSSWERQCLGLPQFLFLASTNQIETKKLFPDAYDFKVQEYKKYHRSASYHFDGLGVQRVSDAVEELCGPL